MKKSKTSLKESRKFPQSRQQRVVIPGSSSEMSSYVEVMRKLKHGINIEELGVNVTRLTHTKSGCILMAVGRGAESALAAEKLKVAVEAVLGSDAGVRLQTNLLRLEFHDVSVDDNMSDVQEGFQREGVRPANLKLNWIKANRSRIQTVSVQIPEHEALRLLKLGRIRNGLVYCRLRLQPARLPRCYRCHDYGHLEANCDRPSWANCCLSCGGKEHRARYCGNPADCVLCKELGVKAWNHYAGSGCCKAYRRAAAEDSRKEKKRNKTLDKS